MEKRILIATPVKQNEEIFVEYLNSINRLVVSKDYIVDKFFYLYNCPELSKYLEENEYNLLYDNDDNNLNNDIKEIYALYQMKTALLKKASQDHYDYLFMVDSNILLHPKTLQLLLNDNKDVVGNIVWTKNQNKIEINCKKNEELEIYKNLDQFYIPGIYRIGWISNCILISSKIFNNPNILYYPVPGVGANNDENYGFCLRVTCNFPECGIWIDTRLPARCIYDTKDYIRWIEEKRKYE